MSTLLSLDDGTVINVEFLVRTEYMGLERRVVAHLSDGSRIYLSPSDVEALDMMTVQAIIARQDEMFKQAGPLD